MTDQQKPLWGADNNALIALLAVNLVIAAGLGFMKVTYYLEGFPVADFKNEIYQYVVLNPKNIGNSIWTLFTFNWTHDGFWTLFTNLFWLLIFGTILQNNGYNKHLFPIYFYSGLIAGLSYILHRGAIPFIGAQTSVLALACSTIVLTPKYKIFPNIFSGFPAWLIAVLYFVLTALSISQENFLVGFSILLGGFSGLIYAWLLKKEIDLGGWMRRLFHTINNSLTPKN
jgi:membrane associated rhomboid family serine protease